MLIVIAIVILCLIFGPQLWCQATLKRYSTPIDNLPGTGGELARHLLDRFEMKHVKVEMGQAGEDHYDPQNKIVCLADENYSGKSLTAVTVAAHEVGHAIQDQLGYPPLRMRTQLANFAIYAEKMAAVLLISVPFIAMLTKMPHLGILTFTCGITILLLPVILHLFTLPVEFDASFGRALPILEQGKYLPENTMPIAHKILTAAALTYVSASLMSLLNFYRWIYILRK